VSPYGPSSAPPTAKIVAEPDAREDQLEARALAIAVARTVVVGIRVCCGRLGSRSIHELRISSRGTQTRIRSTDDSSA
jgi:hypothetical protein